MEISEMEYLALKVQVQTLQNQVNSINGPKKMTSFSSMVREPVIDCVRNVAAGKPVFGYRRSYNSDVWTLMNQIAKALHEPSNFFRMESRGTYGHTYPYINTILSNGKPRRISDLTPEQIKLSVQMLDEMIPIYNRYFKMTHQKVLYDPTGKGDYEPIGVVDDDALNQDSCEIFAMGEIYG